MDTTVRSEETLSQGVYLKIPAVDWLLLKELARKFGWQAETREELLNRFVNSRPSTPALSEEEILNEVKVVRYNK